jgi:aerobic C4-dicarboxylate transport protein
MAARFARSLYVQVLVAVALGVVLGHLRPQWGIACGFLGELFIKLIKMLVAPLIFTTVVTGIARLGDLRRLGRLGLKTIVYFEAVTTLALLIGLAVGHLVQPGAGMHAVGHYVPTEKPKTFVEHLLALAPRTLLSPLTEGDVLQVLLVSLLVGIAAASLGRRTQAFVDLVDELGQVVFKVVEYVVRLSPLGAFGAMASTVGRHGLGTLLNLGKLVGCFYLTSALFVLLVLGLIARAVGFSIFSFLRYIGGEILIVLGTSSSESALARLIDRMEQAGAAPEVVRVVVPLGYSFNLDGTSIYLTLATLFVAQATDTTLSFGQELLLLGVLLLTSKGAAAVTGGGFVTLSATLSSARTVPPSSVGLIVGVDRFMSEARAITNLIGNGVAALVIARWEKALDRERLAAALSRPSRPSPAPRPSEPRPRS